jgi:DNA-directed RNA polymerase II subunit RPB1
MYENNVTVLDIKTNICAAWANRNNDTKNVKREYKNIVRKITRCAVLSNFDNSAEPVVHIKFDANNFNINTMVQFQEMIMTTYRIRGIVGFSDSIKPVLEDYYISGSDGELLKMQQYLIEVRGINIDEIAQFRGINMEKTVCNDISTILNVYGIEAARIAFIKELNNSLVDSGGGGSSNYQHISMLSDAITHMGDLIPVNRHGANKLDTDPLSRASFEETVDQMLSSAVFAESDGIKSVSAKVMIGEPIRGGTGAFDLLLNHNLLKKLNIATSAKATTAPVVRRTNVSELIRKKQAGQLNRI